MPSKSRRDKVVPLTTVKKKTSELKVKTIKKIRQSLAEFSSLFVFSYNDGLNARQINVIRDHWRSKGRFHMGKNKVIAYALGKDKASEQEEKLHLVGRMLRGNKALLFTDCTIDQVKKWSEAFVNDGGVSLALEARWSKDGTFESTPAIVPDEES